MLGEPKANVRFVRFRPGFTPEWNVRVVLLSEVSSVVYVLGLGTGLSEFTLILVFMTRIPNPWLLVRYVKYSKI